jgi:Fe-Mn family superoxide dismutase
MVAAHREGPGITRPTIAVLRGATMTFQLPDLPYSHDALQPFMSKETLEFHHDKHHQAYVTNGNKLLEGSGLEGKSLEEVVKGSFGKNAGLFNNAGQHYNHIHFWKWMKKGGGGKKLPGPVQTAIDKDLGGYDKFRTDFVQAGVTQFGSGWAWVSVKNGKLEISKTPNGENPLVHGGTPILGVDVWEHSYYIDYRNLRQKYLEAFVDSLINWDYVAERLAAAK